MQFDVETFSTTIPGLLGLPRCDDFSIAESFIIRPVQRQDKWAVKKKSVRYLEACPNELRKWLSKCVESKEDAFVGLFLSLCQRPRLDAVLSKDPQLRDAGGGGALLALQSLFRQDAQEAFDLKLLSIKVAAPVGCLKAAYQQADSRVAEWLGLSERPSASL